MGCSFGLIAFGLIAGEAGLRFSHAGPTQDKPPKVHWFHEDVQSGS
jgi:hypothetical protein